MVILGNWDTRPITISAKPNCLTISIEAAGQAEVFSFDYAGRLWTALANRISYRRGLDGKMIARWQTEDGGHDRRWLAPEEAGQVDARARQRAAGLIEAIRSGAAVLNSPLPSQASLGFERVLAFDAPRSIEDAAHYENIYQPVGILPPDQYMAVVLQATEGCAFNTCTFCDFYKSRPFRIKTQDAFEQHALAVRDFLGAGLSLRRTIFLGDANALVVPMPRLIRLLDVVHSVYDVEALGGIYAFLDGFSGEKKSPRDYALLAERGVKRVYVGLESGNEGLLKFLKKPGKPEDIVKAVRAMKAGGLAVGVIALLGAGGHTYHRPHVRDTIRAINAMDLDMDDLVYFSELVVSEGMAYMQDAYAAHLQPLTPEERAAQGEVIEQGLKFSRRRGVPHICRYDVREFVY